MVHTPNATVTGIRATKTNPTIGNPEWPSRTGNAQASPEAVDRGAPVPTQANRKTKAQCACRLIAVASGKGGVGKTVIAANLAHALAHRVKASDGKVVAADLDLGCGNLNAALGVKTPAYSINSFFVDSQLSLNTLLVTTDQPNLGMISGCYGMADVRLGAALRRRLIDELRAMDAQYVVLDLGAGTSPEVMDLFLEADERIIVITPESYSLHNAFLFLKNAILRFLYRELATKRSWHRSKLKVRELLRDRDNVDVRKLIEELKLWDLHIGYILSALIDNFTVSLVVNKYRGDKEEGKALLKFHDLLFRYLLVRTNLKYLGFVRLDRHVHKSVQKLAPLLRLYPNCSAATDIRNLAARIEQRELRDSSPPLRLPRHSRLRDLLARLFQGTAPKSVPS